MSCARARNSLNWPYFNCRAQLAEPLEHRLLGGWRTSDNGYYVNFNNSLRKVRGIRRRKPWACGVRMQSATQQMHGRLTSIRESRTVERRAASNSQSNGTQRKHRRTSSSTAFRSSWLRPSCVIPLSVTTFDDVHSETEERWITVGRAVTGECLVVVHTWVEIDASAAKARIISAREADNSERLAYEEGL
jgi:uncharacterized DUF497 family protein